MAPRFTAAPTGFSGLHKLITPANPPPLWRGSLLPLGGAAVVKPAGAVCLNDCNDPIGAASQPSGSKLPRHNGPAFHRRSYCGSEPARDSGVTVNADVACATVIASKLAPTGFSGLHKLITPANTPPLWRGSLLPLGGAAVVKPAGAVCLNDCNDPIGAASQPSGSKLPRHNGPHCAASSVVGAWALATGCIPS